MYVRDRIGLWVQALSSIDIAIVRVTWNSVTKGGLQFVLRRANSLLSQQGNEDKVRERRTSIDHAEKFIHLLHLEVQLLQKLEQKGGRGGGV